ncbi:DUF1194 domain-containing protein [Sulfitobacter sp. D35]|uniref:DUF1194 domain-containing protein n=1 Tax=Sulfitobacter sp. D35 TaxID=3083252 RepID=UPI00296FA247|nr:DUF1194 domain-containing protein [Sulfitobacter sp. D35]MDW4499662.1 DUF1194 domain-containing protein [Sulfitobacter sp. D35]
MLRAVGVFVAFLGLCAQAQADCRQALALGLDVSGSVDLREYRMQLDGVVTALNDDGVVRALLSRPDAPISLLIFEWSGPEDQATLVPWTPVTSRGDIAAISAVLAATSRRDATPGTALGEAMSVGVAYLAQQPGCARHTLDLSGDGKSNLGPRPRDVKASVAASGVTVNGLVIGTEARRTGEGRMGEIAELSAYFRAEVIVGPDAFVETALGYEAYAEAMTRKLRRELDGELVSRLDLPGDARLVAADEDAVAPERQ